MSRLLGGSSCPQVPCTTLEQKKTTYKDSLVGIGNRLAAVGGVVKERVEGPQLVNVPVDEGVHRKQPLHVQD
jgi:hypothetical protein